MGRRISGSRGVSVYQGRYHRTLGKVLNEQGQVVPKKFLLGTDLRFAEAVSLRLERLWDEVLAEHASSVQWMQDMGGRLGDADHVGGHMDRTRLRRLDLGPLWRTESLAIAEVIRRGEHQVPVGAGEDAEQPGDYVGRLEYLRRTYHGVDFVPAARELYLEGQQLAMRQAQALVVEAQEVSARARVSLPEATGQTLHQALDAYAEHALRANTKESGQAEATCTRRLKDAHADIPLEQFGITAMESIAAYWAARPVSKKTGRPVALDTVTNHLKTARRFVHWLHRTDAFSWTKPVDAELALRVRVKRLRNDQEIAALSKGVAVWSIGELATLYRYATDRERFLILLGLNCAFAQAEFCTLRHDEVVRDGSAVIIKRVRRKSHIYGEFVLWPQSVAALDWFLQWNVTADASREDGAYVMLTLKGQRFDRTRLANLWNRLLDRVQRDLPDFRRLPFKHLRKTGGQLVRQRSDGEIAGVFLCHGKPVASDELSDVYTNRPFGKVAAALQMVQADLRPMFDAAPNAFLEKPGSSPNITRGMIERIQVLHSKGSSPAEIVQVTGLTLQTVRRWIGRSQSAEPVV